MINACKNRVLNRKIYSAKKFGSKIDLEKGSFILKTYPNKQWSINGCISNGFLSHLSMDAGVKLASSILPINVEPLSSSSYYFGKVNNLDEIEIEAFALNKGQRVASVQVSIKQNDNIMFQNIGIYGEIGQNLKIPNFDPIQLPRIKDCTFQDTNIRTLVECGPDEFINQYDLCFDKNENELLLEGWIRLKYIDNISPKHYSLFTEIFSPKIISIEKNDKWGIISQSNFTFWNSFPNKTGNPEENWLRAKISIEPWNSFDRFLLKGEYWSKDGDIPIASVNHLVNYRLEKMFS